jgi:hypothetical protein
MPSKTVGVMCDHCRKVTNHDIYYTTNEQDILEVKKQDGKFYGKIWGGVFVFGITVLLFIWALVLMLKTFEMKKLDKVLGDPNVQYEDTWYNKESSDPALKTDTVRVIKPGKSGVVSAGIESLQKELDQAKKNASEDRQRIRELLQDTDQLIRAYKDLEKMAQEKKVEVDKVAPPEEKK